MLIVFLIKHNYSNPKAEGFEVIKHELSNPITGNILRDALAKWFPCISAVGEDDS